MTGFIYVITNDINGKQYVGKTTDTLQGRFSDHCKDSVLEHCKGRPLYYAMNKYGKEHFHISQLEECDLDILPQREQYWIEKLNTYNNGYNATRGGEGSQIYDYNLFVKDYNDGMLIKQIADKYSCDPTTVSKALHKANINTMTNLNKLQHYNSIPVEQYTMKGEYLRTFHSGCAAAQWIIDNHCTKTNNIKQVRNNIAESARQHGYRKSAYGFKWKLKE